MSIEAMKLALEALEDANDTARMEFSDEDYYLEAINALRQAIEQAEQAQPVAWLTEGATNGTNVWLSKRVALKFSSTPTPLYTAPPPRKPLTYPQIHELDWPDGVAFEEILLFARAIEAAHGIGEKA